MLFNYGMLVIIERNGRKTSYAGIAEPFYIKQQITDLFEISLLAIRFHNTRRKSSEH